MLILRVTEEQFLDVMMLYRFAFSQEALKLIYINLNQTESEYTIFRPLDVEMNYCEEDIAQCITSNNIKVNAFEAPESIKDKVAMFLQHKTIFIGFTPGYKVVYRRISS